MSLQQAVEAPRIWTMMFGELNVEEGFPPEVLTVLEKHGYLLKRVRNVAMGITSVRVDPKTGLLHGAVCWRGDGAAAGWSGGTDLDIKYKYPPVWDTKQ
jgi:gamma-glutamyltranspeptidase